MDQTSPFNDWKITVEHAKRGEIVNRDSIDKHQKNMQQKPYGSSSFGYEGPSGFGDRGYNGGRGGRGGYGYDNNRSSSFNNN